MTPAEKLSDCKVQIGCRYEGIPFDRPCLRRMPAAWTLEEQKPTRIWLIAAVAKATGMLLIVLYAAMVIAQVVK